MLIVLYTRKIHGRHDAWTMVLEYQPLLKMILSHVMDEISNLQFHITIFVKTAVNLMFFSDRHL